PMLEDRVLLSVDMEASFGIFNAYGEYILNKNDNQLLGKFDRTFFYINLNARILKKLRLFIEFNRYGDKNPDPKVNFFLGDGLNKAIVGLNYQPNWVTAVKAEVQRYYYSNESELGPGLPPELLKMRTANTKFVLGVTVVF
ncbi:MAG: hypothetical protein GY765_15800, partial [bacterium]|nr:hypothetical protein [bacterium]